MPRAIRYLQNIVTSRQIIY